MRVPTIGGATVRKRAGNRPANEIAGEPVRHRAYLRVKTAVQFWLVSKVTL